MAIVKADPKNNTIRDYVRIRTQIAFHKHR